MTEITTIGLDLAKKVIQVHGADETGAAVLRKRLRRSEVLAFVTSLPRCLIGMEACVGAHHLSRRLRLLGHYARLMPAKYVRAYSSQPGRPERRPSKPMEAPLRLRDR
jgi:transposase